MGHSIRLSCGPTTATCWLKTSDEGLRCADPGFHLLPHRFQMSLLSRSPSSVPHGVESLEDGWRLRRPCSLYPKVKGRPSRTVSSQQRAAPWSSPRSGTQPRPGSGGPAGPLFFTLLYSTDLLGPTTPAAAPQPGSLLFSPSLRMQWLVGRTLTSRKCNKMLAVEVTTEPSVEGLGVRSPLQGQGFGVWAEYSPGEYELGTPGGPAEKNKAQFPHPSFHHHYEST
ncbi:uncharacterized protein LOC102899230 isoform X1 [Felis catus]|uniref:uncharacterized protein LOC102899230 isoform X1 n=1 Tax=Felis catus TaxID=9685 RepID=UPI001D1A091E|nr:uncharacterized protein LOC102899230 isoform X1 [Felis catus]